MKLGLIPWVMAAGLIPFVPSSLWDRLQSAPPAQDPRERDSRLVVHLAPQLVAGLILAYVFAANLENVSGRGRILPESVHLAARAAKLRQSWKMYSSPPRGRHGLIVQMLLADGSRREFAIGAQRAGWPAGTPWPPLEALFWNDHRGKMYLDRVASLSCDVQLNALLRWVLARWNAEHPTLPAHEIVLVMVVRGPPGSEGNDGLRPVQSSKLIASLRGNQ